MTALAVDRKGKLKCSEADVQRACMDLLRREGWIVRPAPKQGHRTRGTAYEVPAGEPDLIAIKPSIPLGFGYRVLLIECKAADGRISAVQRAWADEWQLPVAVVRSVEDLKAIL